MTHWKPRSYCSFIEIQRKDTNFASGFSAWCSMGGSKSYLRFEVQAMTSELQCVVPVWTACSSQAQSRHALLRRTVSRCWCTGYDHLCWSQPPLLIAHTDKVVESALSSLGGTSCSPDFGAHQRGHQACGLEIRGNAQNTRGETQNLRMQVHSWVIFILIQMQCYVR